MAESEKAIKPPYTAGNDIDTFFSRVQNIAPPPGPITSDWVKAKKLGEVQPSGIVSMLKWLGIVDPQGNVDAGLWNKMRAPASSKDTLDKLIRDSYSAVFAQFDDVAAASRDDIDGAFITAYEAGDPGRLRTCFLKLCEKAGITAPEVRSLARKSTKSNNGTPSRTAPKEQKQKAVRTTDQKPAPNKGGSPGSERTAGTSVSFTIEIPADWNEDQIRSRISLVMSILRTETSRDS